MGVAWKERLRPKVGGAPSWAEPYLPPLALADSGGSKGNSGHVPSKASQQGLTCLFPLAKAGRGITRALRRTNQDPAVEQGPSGRKGPCRTTQGPAGRTGAPQDESGPRGTEQGPDGRTRVHKKNLRVPQDKSGPRDEPGSCKTNRGPQDESGPAGQSRVPRDELGPRKTNQGPVEQN